VSGLVADETHLVGDLLCHCDFDLRGHPSPRCLRASAGGVVAIAPNEAIVFRGTERTTECFLVPVDACYRLVGAVRRFWTGYDGGPEMRDRVGELFAEIARRARPLCPEGR
jgi:hypothetical protein